MAHAMQLQARVWFQQRRLKEAKFEAFEKLGAAKEIELCRADLKIIERVMEGQSTSNNSDGCAR